jgi:hypothetical protein
MSRGQPSLKQRLAALASAPTAAASTSPASPGGVPTSGKSTTARRRSFFSPPWARRGPSVDGMNAFTFTDERDRVQEVMGHLIYQAGESVYVSIMVFADPGQAWTTSQSPFLRTIACS